MTNENRTPEEIERAIEAERSQLSSTLGDLQDKFSIDTLVRQVREQFSEHGGDIGRSVADQVKANPIPLALTAIGLGWLMFGSSAKSSSESRRTLSEESYGTSSYNEVSAYRRPAAVPVRDEGPDWSRDDRDDIPVSPDDMFRRTETQSPQTVPGRTPTKSPGSDGTSTTNSMLEDAGTSSRQAGESVRDTVKTAGRRIAQGTEDLSEEARERVLAARQKAVDMRRTALKSADRGADAAMDFYDRQPLVAGALALAVGSAMAGALPRTKTEDDLMGSQRDQLFSEADRIFEEEKGKVVEVAKAVGDEVKDIAAETKTELDGQAPGDKSAADAAADATRIKADRVVDAATSAAQDNDLGKPRI